MPGEYDLLLSTGWRVVLSSDGSIIVPPPPPPPPPPAAWTEGEPLVAGLNVGAGATGEGKLPRSSCTVINGDVTVTTSQTINNTVIRGKLLIRDGGHVTADNVWVDGGLTDGTHCDITANGSLNGTFMTFGQDPYTRINQAPNGLQGGNIQLSRSVIMNAIDGIRGWWGNSHFYAVLVKQVSQLWPSAGRSDNKTHSDGFQCEGGDGYDFQWCEIYGYSAPPGGNRSGNVGTPTDGSSHVLYIQDGSWIPSNTPGTNIYPALNATSAVMISQSTARTAMKNLQFSHCILGGGTATINGGGGGNAATGYVNDCIFIKDPTSNTASHKYPEQGGNPLSLLISGTTMTNARNYYGTVDYVNKRYVANTSDPVIRR